MGRLPRKGLEYFSVDTSWETPMKLIKARFGLEGIGFMIELYSSIYHDGYYRKWDEENELLFADEIRKPVEWVSTVMEYCFDKGLFDRERYEKFGVLTSHGIQKRYFKIIGALKRTDFEMAEGIIYQNIAEKISPEEKPISPEEKPISPEEKPISPGGNDHNIRQDNIREYKNKTGKQSFSSRDDLEDTDSSPAAALDSFSEEVYKTLFNSRFRSSFTATECVGISERLEAVGLDTGFVEYAIRKASDTRVRSPGGFLRQALSGAKGFEDWPEKYRAETDVQHTEVKQTKAPRPTTCDECGGKLRPTSSEAMCTSCGARWKYDSAFNIWQKVEELEKSGSGV